MKKTLQLVLLLLLGYSTQAQTTTSLFPVLNPTDDKDLHLLDFKPENSSDKKDSFLGMNPDYFKTGKYMYHVKNPNPAWGIGNIITNVSFNNYEYPSVEVNSSNLINNYSNVKVIFNGMLPFITHDFNEGECYWHRCFSTTDFEKDSDAHLHGKDLNEIYNDLNNYYKSKINDILKSKSTATISVQDMLKNKIDNSNSLNNSLIFQFNLEDIAVLMFTDGKKNPDFARYSLSIINTKGDLVKKYKQVVFFYGDKTSHIGKVKPNECVKITILPAFNSLLNQFLNDTKTNDLLKNYNLQQQTAIAENNRTAVNKLQIDLLNIKLEKATIITQLQQVGVNMEGLKNYTPINSSSLYNYNSSYSSQVNQMGSSAAILAGGIANAIEANAQRKRIEKNNRIGDKLKMRFNELDDEEKRITAAIPPEILNSPAVLFLPNNADLNQYMQAATQSYNQKSTAASTNLTQQTSKMMSDWKAENDAMNTQMQKSSLSPESSAVTNGANGTNTTPDGNSPEAMQCSKKTKEQWRNTSVAYKKFMTTERTQANGYRSQKDLIEMTLANCGQFIPQNEQDVLRKEILNLNKVISDLENSGGVNRFDAPPPSTNNTQTPSPTPIPQQSSGTGAVIAR